MTTPAPFRSRRATPALEEHVERLHRRLLRRVAELPLEPGVRQHRSIAKEVDLEYLAHQFKLAGGNIKNIALAAAYLSIESDGIIEMVHLLQATRREYQKLGKVLSEAEINDAIVNQRSAVDHSESKPR